jgi:uncharacterized protein (DUF1778 family)
MKKKIRTQKPMIYFSSRMPRSDLELLRAAAAREEISVSEFFRVAVRERARRILFSGGTEERRQAVDAA